MGVRSDLVMFGGDLRVFEKLSADQIGKLAGMFGECAADPPDTEKIRKLVGKEISHSDIGRIARSFSFFGKTGTADLRRLVNSSSLDKDKVPAVCTAIDSVHKSAAARMRGGSVERSGHSRESLDFLSMFGMKPKKTPPPTIMGMLEGCAGGKDSMTLVREMRDGW